jgi:4-alpha-glucanotransferase
VSAIRAAEARRAAGILLHPTCLPGPYGIGDIGGEAHAFVDWLKGAGQRLWQVLALGPPGHGGSPYSSHSAFAGSPLLVGLDRLLEAGLLNAGDLADAPSGDPARVDFGHVVPWKAQVLRRAFARFKQGADPARLSAFRGFRSAREQKAWLDDWCLYSAIKARHAGAAWPSWPEPLRRREEAALEAARAELLDEVELHAFVQFLFFEQWAALKRAANSAGIRIVGDIPIYVALDSADCWANQSLFDLDDHQQPRGVAGVPPDYFSRTGQLWGNPLYRWDRMQKAGFEWWLARLRANLRLADVVRIDHFRAFASYWAVPATEQTAVNGRWVKAPGKALFDTVRRRLGDVAIVAEDLGHITPDVERLLEHTRFPRMKVLQFAFSQLDDPFLPHNYESNCVVYTGTHDNDTTRGWWAGLNETDRGRVLDYLGGRPEEIEWSLIRGAYNSVADRALVPLQDVLGLGAEARMNTPALAAGNWAWRARRHEFTPERQARLRRLAELSGRV